MHTSLEFNLAQDMALCCSCSAFAKFKVMQSNQSQDANQIHGVIVHFDAQYCFQNSGGKINQKED
jgi:hypothetical protein